MMMRSFTALAVSAFAALALVAGCQTTAHGGPLRVALEGKLPPAVDVAEINGSSQVIQEPAKPWDSIAGAYLAGRQAQRVGNYAVAADQLDKALAGAPDNGQLLNQTFSMMLAAGRVDRALELAPKVLETEQRGLGLAAVLLAADALKDERYVEAQSIVEGAGADRLARYPAPLFRAWALVGQGEVSEAVASLEGLGDDSGGFGRLKHLHAGLIFHYAGRPEDALEAVSGELEPLDKAPTGIVRLTARARLASGDRDGAVQLLQDFVDANPSLEAAQVDLKAFNETGDLAPMVDGVAAGAAEGIYQLAVAFRNQAQTISLEYARIAAFLDPNLELARLVIADILEEKERYAEAIAELEEVPPTSPYSWEARIRIGEALIAMERDDAARAHLKAMAAERPDSIEPLMSLGQLLRSREKFEEASKVYDKVLERKPDTQPEDWLIYYFRGITHERIKEWPAAEADFLKALELKPDDPFVLNYLGYSWVDRGENIERAKKMIKRAVEQRRSDGNIVDSLGWAHYKLGEFDEAVTHLERAVQLNPKEPVINDHLGDAYWRVGRKREARFQWNRALSLDPEPELATEIEKKLQHGMDSFQSVTSE